jgi:hypothetical protein
VLFNRPTRILREPNAKRHPHTHTCTQTYTHARTHSEIAAVEALSYNAAATYTHNMRFLADQQTIV